MIYLQNLYSIPKDISPLSEAKPLEEFQEIKLVKLCSRKEKYLLGKYC